MTGLSRALAGGILSAALLATPLAAQQLPREEFRAAWLCTVDRLDWPPNPATNTPAQQRAALRTILDKYQQLNMNAVVFQVRSEADSMFDSDLEPWSRGLAGANGAAPDPLWDPLQYLIDECRRRGLEVHAWFNPYRAGVTRTRQFDTSHVSHPSNPMNDTVRSFDTYYWFDPGVPRVREYGLEVVMDVVRRYDIDAVHFDDYFYPYGINATTNPFPDGATFAQYNDAGFNLGDFRRDSVNAFVEEIYRAIRNEPGKEHVRFGLSPFGIWRPGNPPGITGLDSYASIFADSRLWWREGWVDYFTPQLYWFRAADGGATGQDYDALLPWWANSQQNVHGRHLWPGIPNYKIGTTRPVGGGTFTSTHLGNLITSTRNVAGATGNVHFRTGNLTSSGGAGIDGVSTLLQNNHYAVPSVIPPTTWLPGTENPQPAALGFTGTGPYTLRWRQPAAEQANVWLLRTVESGNVRFRVLPGWQEQIVLPVGSSEATLTALDRLSNRGVPLTISFSTPTPAPPVAITSSSVQNFETATIGSNNWFFQRPGFGTASANVAAGGTTTITTADANHLVDPRVSAPGSRSERANWSWTTPSEGGFLRLTTFGSNPALDLRQGFGFYYKLPAGSLDVSLQIRETGGSGPIGSDGGTNGPIERSEYRRISASANWQYIWFDIPNLAWTNEFTGNGVLEGDWGVLESLGIRQVPGEPVTSFTFFVDDFHQGAAHTPLGPPAMPQQVVAGPGQAAGTILLNWRELNIESNFAGYHVYRAPAGERVRIAPIHRVAVLPPGTTQFVDTMVLDGQQYEYRLVSVNDRGAVSVPAPPVLAVASPRTVPAPAHVFANPATPVVLPIASASLSGFVPGGGGLAYDSRGLRIVGTRRGDLEFGGLATDEFFTRTGTGFATGGFFRTTISGQPVFGLRPSLNEMPAPRVEHRVRNSTGGQVTSVTVSFTLFTRNSGSRSSTLAVLAGPGEPTAELRRVNSPRRRTTATWQQTVVNSTLSLESNPIAPGEYFHLAFDHQPLDGAGDFDEFAWTDITLTFEGDGGALTPVESDVWMMVD